MIIEGHLLVGLVDYSQVGGKKRAVYWASRLLLDRKTKVMVDMDYVSRSLGQQTKVMVHMFKEGRFKMWLGLLLW